jgi:hypothetical protein
MICTGPAAVGADVGTALDLGDELRGMEALIIVRAQQAGKETALLVSASDLLHELDRAGGAGYGAGVAGFAMLVEEIGDAAGEDLVPGFGECRQNTARPEDPPGLVVGGVEHDLLHCAPEAIVPSQLRQVLIAIRFADEAVEASSGLIADRSQESVRLGPPRAQMAVQEAPDVSIACVSVPRRLIAPTVEIFSRGFCCIFGGHRAPPAGV